MSLVELVVAITVLAVVLLGLAGSLASGLRLVRGNRQRVVAANLATQEMERVRSLDFSEVPLGRTETTETVDNIPYTVRQDVTWVDQGSSGGPCDGGTSLDFLRVDMSVFWRDMDGIAPIESQTLLSPSAGSFDPAKGNIAVEVRDRNAAPLAGQPVTISGPSGNDSQVTTADGCAFFPQLTVGTYTAGVVRTGYVDGRLVVAPTQSLAVVAGGAPASWSLDFDQAATLSLTLAAPGGGTVPSGLSVMIRNDHLSGSRTKTYAGTGTSRTIGNLFPFAEGYEVWAGDCIGTRPFDADGSPLDAGVLATEPGQTTAATINLPTVDVTVRRGNGTPVAGTTVSAVTCGKTYVVGTTSATGTLMAAVPYGSVQFKATVGASTGTTTLNVVTGPRQSTTVVVP